MWRRDRLCPKTCEELPPLLLNQVIQELHFATLVLEVVANTVAVSTGDLAPAQTTDLSASTGARESSVVVLL